jgi:hypothetical protein
LGKSLLTLLVGHETPKGNRHQCSGLNDARSSAEKSSGG